MAPPQQPQMDRDIRRAADPETARKVAIERPHSANVSSGSGTASVSSTQQRYEEPNSEGEDDEYLVHPSHNEVKRLNLPPEVMRQAQEAREEREQNVSRELQVCVVQKPDLLPHEQLKDLVASGKAPAPVRRESTSSQRDYGLRLDIDPLQPSRSYDKKYSLLDPRSLQKLFKAKQSEENDRQPPIREEGESDDEAQPLPEGNGVEYTRVHAPAHKRIAIPVRIEPKVSLGGVVNLV